MKIFVGFLAATLIIAAVIYVAYTETRPERRILVEENYQPPKRPQAQPAPPPALTPSMPDTEDVMTPMPGDE